MMLRRAQPTALRALLASVVSAFAVATVVASAPAAFGVRADAVEWDERVEPIAREVEEIRGLAFDRPVLVEYLDDAAFRRRVAVDQEITDSQRSRAERSAAQLRAIGLVGPDVDLLGSVSDLQESGVVAYYSPKTKTVTVRGEGLDAASRVTLAHELTHALQDQHFDLLRIQRGARKASADSTARAVIEGDAVRVQREYVNRLSDADRREWARARQEDVTAVEAEVAQAGVPDVLSAFFQAPYTLGPEMLRFVTAVQGDDATDELLRDPPRSELAFLDPTSVLGDVVPLRVVDPELGPGEERLGPRDTFGAFVLYLMLSTTMDPVDALAVVAGWGGDAMVTFERDAQTCIRATFTGRDAATSDRLRAAIEDWSAGGSHPASSVIANGQATTLTACDDGAGRPGPGDAPSRALVAAAYRSTLLAEAAEIAPPAVAACAADGAIADATFAPLLDATMADPGGSPPYDVLGPFQDRLAQVLADCQGR